MKGIHGYDHKFSWLITSANHATIFNLDGQTQWTSSIEQSSLEFAQMMLA
jgi:hypothetical protein